jgi:hypothetical protein
LNKFDDVSDPTKITETISVKAKTVHSTSQSGDGTDQHFAQVCYVCKVSKEDEIEEEESLLVCDTCDFNVVHYQCAKMKEVPPEEEEYECPQCEKDRVIERK